MLNLVKILWYFFCLCYASNQDNALLNSLILSISGLPTDWIPNSQTYCQTYTGVGCVNIQQEYHLQSINLTNYNLTGKLPQKGWKNASKFSILILSNNHLQGSLPAELLELRSGEIYLDHNNFNGILPEASAPSIVSLKALRLQSNKFSGCIPQSWKQISSLCGTDPRCPGINLTENYFNCSQYGCMDNLPLGAPSICPQSFLCEPGKYCWNIPSTIVLIITLSCGGFIVGNLAMFFAAKYIDMGIYARVSDLDEKSKERKLIKKTGKDTSKSS